MSQRLRFGWLLALSSVCVVAAVAVGASQQVDDVIVLGAAMTIGVLVELRPADRAPLPFTFAIVVVLLRAATPGQFVAVVVGASVAGVAIRARPVGWQARSLLLAELFAETLGAGAVYRLITDAGGGTAATPAVVLLALGGAAVCEITVADLVALVRTHTWPAMRSRGADLALVSSGMLMAVGYGGIAGQGRSWAMGACFVLCPAHGCVVFV